MIKALATVLSLILLLQAQAQSANPNYNKALADSLGADEYGMKMYTLVILKSKENNIGRKTKDSLMAGHMKNINQLVSSGKLIIAGPFGKNEKKFSGIFILNTGDIEEAKRLVNTDPSVVAGIFETDIIPWYGSAALAMYLKFHDQVEKTGF